MCAICGIISKFDVDTNAILQSMLDSMKHRGPDDFGIWESKIDRLGVGHRRLSIIDLSSAGHQPMITEDGRYVIAYNGEVYNFLEIRKELESFGFHFKSKCDTEVVLKSFIKWGIKAIDKFNGMFAFSIWDNRNKELFIVRDRLGVKPIYYYWDGQDFIWASELSAIKKVKNNLLINVLGLDLFFTLSYIPSPYTIYENVFKLKPGHYLRYSYGELEVKQYWRPTFKKRSISEKDAQNEVEYLLEDATKKRLISDVQLGAFLSGGVDSSSVVAFMAKNTAKVKTFSICFNEKDFDESKFARNIATLFGTDHHEFIVEPNALDIIDKMVFHFGEPFGDASALPTYYLSELTNKYVTVALSGDGGDEIFCGYDRYAGYKYSIVYQNFPKLFKNLFEKSLILFPKMNHRINDKINWLKKFINDSYLDNVNRELQKKSIFRLGIRKNLLRGVNCEAEKWIKELLSISDVNDEIDRLTFSDLTVGLPDDILVKVDRMSMTHSLEVRSPFLDYRLVELCASLPSSIKMPGFKTKFLLKKIMEKYLPRSILYRKKQGFNIPFKWWLRKKTLSKDIEDLLMSKSEYIDNKVVASLWYEHQEGLKEHSNLLWQIMIWKSWERINNF